MKHDSTVFFLGYIFCAPMNFNSLGWVIIPTSNFVMTTIPCISKMGLKTSTHMITHCNSANWNTKLLISFVSYCPVDDITLGASFRINWGYMTWWLIRPDKKNTSWSSWFLQKEEYDGLFILYLFILSKMAAKHLNSKWPPTFQFKMTDSFLFIAIWQVSWVKISIVCILLNPIVYAHSFQLHFHFTIVPNLKVSKIHQSGNQHDMHRAHQSHTIFIV